MFIVDAMPLPIATFWFIHHSANLQEHLAGAVINPSEEDSRTFTITCASGDTLKIRAANAASRQHWVDVLRSIAETHTQVSAIKHNFHRKRFSKKHFPSIGSHTDILPSRENADAYTNARQQIHHTELWLVHITINVNCTACTELIGICLLCLSFSLIVMLP